MIKLTLGLLAVQTVDARGAQLPMADQDDDFMQITDSYYKLNSQLIDVHVNQDNLKDYLESADKLKNAIDHYELDPQIAQKVEADVQELMQSPEGQDLFQWLMTNNPFDNTSHNIDKRTKAVFMRAHTQY